VSKDAYRAQVDLLIRCLPAVAQVREFALKGGTAINLFHHDMPRLSVDIDLTFLPITDRNTALGAIHSQLAAIADEICRTIPKVNVQLTEGNTPKLLVASPDARIKVEPNTVIRGSLFLPVESDLCQAAQDEYELFVRVQRLAIEDLYGGKLCAALDRQHPRDLFDIRKLLDAGEIQEGIRQAFVVYLASHHRPMAELLAPHRKPMEDLYAHHFVGMTRQSIELEELEDARTRLFDWAAKALSESERRFLLSIKQGEPDWVQLPFEDLDQWPAIQWKLHNVHRMSPRAHKVALKRLRDILGV
jgi:predicted nucleotidyltransferase component of viral defense system